MEISRELIDKILTAIEQRELRSLQWGFTDGSINEGEIFQMISEVLGDVQGHVSTEDLVENLVRERLVFERRLEDGTYSYRSRFAEGLRLLSSLKQLFPNRPWLSAPGLVSDYRVDARQRAYPRRDIPATDALATLAETPHWSGLHQELAQALLQSPDFSLAAFQLRAMQQILRLGKDNSGVVISAGTGSGKTLAFYLPVTVEIGALAHTDEHWVKAVALYPRIELLKDQFNQVFRFVMQADNVLKQRGRRPIRLGTFFSLTPWDRNINAVQNAGWSESGSGFVCPFLSCPICGSELLWRKDDIEQGTERLVCRKSPHCSGMATSDHVVLTRLDLIKQPSDIVFTTTEMLNQRLSDTSVRHVLGVQSDTRRRVRFVLLDEVHTYDGAAGAQTALAIRRWRHALGSPVRFVGLSATLREAPQFFSDLVGLDTGSVVEVKPTEDEYEYQSMIYQVVLRGNPASQTQLLSTSIQTSFLLRRLLDPTPAAAGQPGPSNGRYGSRLFVFTDDLDVTNRLYDNLRDAEAYNIFGNPEPRREPLAALRRSTDPDPVSRDRSGQNWRFLETIGHQLDRRLRISRTSSQDTGVDSSSDIIVATSSLELGFNDPMVGAVLQHKSPHEMPAYVQRRGRAGRTQDMRPWMVTVLSDYGRDRLTYQAYDQLFDPILMPKRLPMKNRYILRMQAVLALMDWLATTLENSGSHVWMWRVLNGPATGDAYLARQQEMVSRVLDALLKGEGNWLQRLSIYLQKALQLENKDEVASLLWEPPRSLMLEVIPTLSRRLFTQWRISQQDADEPKMDIMSREGRVHPLPDFVPATLFSELNVPDVTVVIPAATTRHEERFEFLGIVQALGQLVPGRITRRFAFERGGLHHWVPVPIEGGEYTLPISRYAEQYELVAMVPITVEGEVKLVPCFRPWTVRLSRVSEHEVSPTSNAVLTWRSQIIASGEPISASTTYDAIWGNIIIDSEFYLHAFRAPLTVRRLAVEATATIRRPRMAQEVRVHTHFTTEDGQVAAIGFEQEVDGLRLCVQLPNHETMAQRVAQSSNTPAWRAAYFRDCVLEDPILETETNRFQRDWLHQIYLSALLTKAIEARVSLAEAQVKLNTEDTIATFEQVMESIFRIDPYQQEDAEELGETLPSEDHRQSLQGRLLELLRRPAILERLNVLALVLWNADLNNWHSWLVNRLRETLADAVLQACYRMAPGHVESEGLSVDVGNGLPEVSIGENTIEIWITETTLGGAGVIEAIAEEAVAHPRVLLTAIEAALAPSDLETVASGLNTFVRLSQEDDEVANIIEVLRRQQTHEEHEHQFRLLSTLLAHRGLSVDQSLSIALHQRLLRQGTSAESDRLISELLTYRRDCEERFGITIDLRVFCYLAILNPSFSARLNHLISENTGSNLSQAESVATLAGLLWPQPAEQRGRSLQAYNYFHTSGWTDATLVRDLLLTNQVATVAFEESDWYDHLHTALANVGIARLACRRENEERLHRALYRLLAEPIDVDYLQFFPVIDEIHRDEASTIVTVSFKELL